MSNTAAEPSFKWEELLVQFTVPQKHDHILPSFSGEFNTIEFLTGPQSEQCDISLIQPDGTIQCVSLEFHILPSVGGELRHWNIQLRSEADLFFAYHFNCNPFSIRTMSKINGWQETDFEELLTRFGDLFRACIRACIEKPDRYKAYHSLKSSNHGEFKIEEKIHGYRYVTVLQFTFTKTFGKQLLSYIQSQFKSCKEFSTECRDLLLNAMDKISQVNPTLVAQLPLEIPETQLKGWVSYVEKYLAGDRMQDSNDYKNTSPNEYSVLVFTKSINVMIGEEEEEPTAVVTNIFQNNETYTMTMTRSDDCYFGYTSNAITRDRFVKLCHRLNLLGTNVMETNTEGHSQLMKLLGFHVNEGQGGLLGIVGGDCINGLVQDPLRRRAAFVLPPKIDNEWDPATPAQLIFYEKILFKESIVFSLELLPMGQDTLESNMKASYQIFRNTIQRSKTLLDAILKVLHDVNPILYREIFKMRQHHRISSARLGTSSNIF